MGDNIPGIIKVITHNTDIKKMYCVLALPIKLPSFIPTRTLSVGIRPCKITKIIKNSDSFIDEENKSEIEYLNSLTELIILRI